MKKVKALKNRPHKLKLDIVGTQILIARFMLQEFIRDNKKYKPSSTKTMIQQLKDANRSGKYLIKLRDDIDTLLMRYFNITSSEWENTHGEKKPTKKTKAK